MCSTLVAALAESLKESCCLPSSDQSGRITTLTVYGKFDYTWCLNICGKTLLRAQIRKLFFFFFFFEPTSSQAQPRGHWQRRRRPALGSGWPFSGKACLARGALLCSGGSRTKEHGWRPCSWGPGIAWGATRGQRTRTEREKGDTH